MGRQDSCRRILPRKVITSFSVTLYTRKDATLHITLAESYNNSVE